MVERHLSPATVAELLDVNEMTVLRWCADGLLDSRLIVRPGKTRGTRLISEASVQRLLKGGRPAATVGGNVIPIQREA